MGLCFSAFQGEAHMPCSPVVHWASKKWVCALIQCAVPILMMASTCCFNVTAGSPSIPHWLWLPSAGGSAPLYLPPSISSAISAIHICFHFHLMFLISILPPNINLSATSAFYSLPITLCLTSLHFSHLSIISPSSAGSVTKDATRIMQIKS